MLRSRPLVAFLLLAAVGCSSPMAADQSTTAPTPGPTTAARSLATAPGAVSTFTTGSPLASTVPSTSTAPPAATTTVVGGGWTPPAQTATAGCTLHGADPDVACTPGALNPRVDQANIDSTICVAGWSRIERATYLPASRSAALKRKVAGYYSPRGVPATSEGDHLISIELGGDPSGGPNGNGANFFDEPHVLAGPDGQPAGSPIKDKFENYLRRQVCARHLTLNEAQREIATDWYQAYVGAGRPVH